MDIKENCNKDDNYLQILDETDYYNIEKKAENAGYETLQDKNPAGESDNTYQTIDVYEDITVERETKAKVLFNSRLVIKGPDVEGERLECTCRLTLIILNIMTN